MAPDLAGLVGTYREAGTTTSWPRTRRRRLALLLVVIVFVAVIIAISVVQHTFPWFPSIYGVIWPGVAFLQIRRPRRCVISTDALVVRASSISRSRRLAWDDVVAIRVQGPWDFSSAAVLRQGGEVLLPALPQEVAARLADAVAAVRPEVERPVVKSVRTATPRATPTTADGEPEWEGPFRRSRSQG